MSDHVHTVVVADDITGAHDIGIMYAKVGLDTFVYSQKKLCSSHNDGDILVIDTDSRFDLPAVAYDKVYRATKKAATHKPKQFYNKQCSVFRGNIGAEFDAMLDALDENFAVVVLGFPDNGRTTIQGTHYVHGVPLHKSQFKDDPVHPMHESNLVSILQSQTDRKVLSLYADELDKGLEELTKQIQQAKKICNYLIIDVRDNADLQLIAQAVYKERIICGSSALGFYLAQLYYTEAKFCSRELSYHSVKQKETLCIIGSLTPQTKGQLQWIQSQGYVTIKLDTTLLFEEPLRKQELHRVKVLVREAFLQQKNSKNPFVALYSMQDENEILLTREKATLAGLDTVATASVVSSALADITKEIVKEQEILKLIFCGGDTSATLCDALDICGMRIDFEVEPGLPTCQSLKLPYYACVLKSGSFGSEDFIVRAIKALNTYEKGVCHV